MAHPCLDLPSGFPETPRVRDAGTSPLLQSQRVSPQHPPRLALAVAALTVQVEDHPVERLLDHDAGHVEQWVDAATPEHYQHEVGHPVQLRVRVLRALGRHEVSEPWSEEKDVEENIFL